MSHWEHPLFCLVIVRKAQQSHLEAKAKRRRFTCTVRSQRTLSGHSSSVLMHSKKVLQKIVGYEEYMKTRYEQILHDNLNESEYNGLENIKITFHVDTSGKATARIHEARIIQELGQL